MEKVRQAFRSENFMSKNTTVWIWSLGKDNTVNRLNIMVRLCSHYLSFHLRYSTVRNRTFRTEKTKKSRNFVTNFFYLSSITIKPILMFNLFTVYLWKEHSSSPSLRFRSRNIFTVSCDIRRKNETQTKLF